MYVTVSVNSTLFYCGCLIVWQTHTHTICKSIVCVCVCVCVVFYSVCMCVDGNSLVCSSSATPQRKPVAAKRKLDLMKTATPSSVPLPSPAGPSVADPEPSSSEEIIDCTEGQPRNWCIVDIGQLNKLMASAVCPECMTAGCLTVVKDGAQPMGFAASLHLQCSCSYESDFVYSSPRVGDTEKLHVPFEINTSMTLYATQIGKGHEALEVMRAVLGTENMQQKTFSRHQKKNPSSLRKSHN